jgi:hypothetical protein
MQARNFKHRHGEISSSLSGGKPHPESPNTFHHSTWQEDDQDQEHDPQREFPALTHKQANHTHHDFLEPIGQEAEEVVQDLMVEG